jgi:hypothetical protein
LCGAMRRTLVSRRHIKDPGRVLLLAAYHPPLRVECPPPNKRTCAAGLLD